MAKRKPDKQLTHENWAEEDAPEDLGYFQKASSESMKGRVIKLAKRRINNVSNANSTNLPEPKSIFAGFSGFTNQPESKKFSFTTDIIPATTTASASNPSEGSKSGFKFSSFIVAEPPKVSKTTDMSFSSSLSAPSSNQESEKSNKLQELSAELKKNSLPAKSEIDADSTSPDDVFVQKLRSLNLLCAEWIIKHLNENLSYILTPIFDDYQKYLNKLKEERQRASTCSTTSKKAKLDPTPSLKPSGVELGKALPPGSKPSATATDTSSKAAPAINFNCGSNGLGSGAGSTSTSTALFKAPDFKSTLTKINSFSSLPCVEKSSPQLPPAFAFSSPPPDGGFNLKFCGGSDKSCNNVDALSKDASHQGKGDGGGGVFKFAAPPKPVESKSATEPPKLTFSFKAPPTVAATTTSSSMFGNGPLTANGKLFSGLSSSPLPSAERLTETGDTKTTNAGDDDDESSPPPPVNETVTEEGAVYEKKCKVFIKKDGAFVDHGVGFLFVKLVGEPKKCQLIVRANNKLASIILNVLLGANVPPLQLMGTNNVCLVCCPTPEAKPSTVLLRVKTADDAAELLKTLNEYKK